MSASMSASTPRPRDAQQPARAFQSGFPPKFQPRPAQSNAVPAEERRAAAGRPAASAPSVLAPSVSAMELLEAVAEAVRRTEERAEKRYERALASLLRDLDPGLSEIAAAEHAYEAWALAGGEPSE